MNSMFKTFVNYDQDLSRHMGHARWVGGKAKAMGNGCQRWKSAHLGEIWSWFSHFDVA